MRNFALLTLSFVSLFGSSVFGQTETLRSEVLADAQTRSSLNGASSGHDSKGFFIAGDNGFRLNVSGDFQFRYTYNPSRANPVSGNNSETGFNIPLARLRFSGNVNESVDFMLESGFDRANGNASLLDAYAGIALFQEGRLQFGQFKLPFMKEVNVSEQYQLAVDRSVTSYVFGQGRSQGVQFGYNTDKLSLIAAISDGFNTANTNFTDPAESDFALTLRGEYAIFGSNQNSKEFTSARNQENTLVAGMAFHYQDGDTQDSMYSYTGDMTWKYNGWNAFLSGVGRNIESNAGSFDDFGLALQGGYRITDNIEPFARYDVVIADSSRNFTNHSFNFLTSGVNYYLYGQAAKLSTDVVWSINETNGLGTMANFSNTGLLGSSNKNEVAFRMQFQVLF